MDSFRRQGTQAELTALSICPDRELAQAFAGTLPQTRAFHILAEIKAYPALQALDIRLRQLRPDVVFLDLATDLEQASRLIEFIAAQKPPVRVVGLHHRNDPEAILQSLRAGATEFLYYPFEIDMQREAIGRILRLRQPTSRTEVTRARLIAFANSKPGSGASTLASQAAYSIQRATGKRVLLADFDLWCGAAGFFFKVSHWYCLWDALKQMTNPDNDWTSLVVNADGVDVLPAPDVPRHESVDPDQLHDLLEYTRTIYDYVVVDLPSVFDRISVMTLADTDEAFLVTTAEMPALHLTRRAVMYLSGLGIGQERYRVLVNRLGRQDSISGDELGKIFGAPVHKTFPNDYLALHKGLTVGQPLGTRNALGRSIEELTQQLSGQAATQQKRAG